MAESVRYQVEADIASAATLDARFYNDETAFHALGERVFARTWQWIGEAADVREPGSLSPRELRAGALVEPLLLSRDAGGKLRCLSNVCTHRGNILVGAPCRAKEIRCGYHSRRFDLAGRMTFMPEFQDAKNFPSASDNLPQVPFAEWLGHAFASIDPVAPLEAFVGDVAKYVGWMGVERFAFDAVHSRDYELDASWALYVENYLEGFHIPFVHHGLNEVVDYGSYSSTLFRYANLQRALAKGSEPAFDLPPGSPEHGQRVAAYYFFVFPNLMLNFYPWGLSLNLVQPRGLEATTIAFRSYVWDASKLGAGAGSELDRVEYEDEAVVRAVSRGVRSRFYRHGRYSPTRERGVHHFHRLLCEFLGNN
ncbi:choline monooxygenase [Betaproteobacteria bacterium GR16-43]|nr:choline monooxygenase [Betaproteobacteria bacterium GR16-43]